MWDIISSVTVTAESGGGVAEVAAANARHWSRALAVAEILDASLSAISAQVALGAYGALLSKSELVALVRALFQPSPPRSALIRALEEQHAHTLQQRRMVM